MAEPIGEPKVESRTISRCAGEDNYCAVLSQRERMLLDGILSDIEKAGYEVQPFIIPACAVEAPHQRERIFIVGRNTDRHGSQEIGSLSGRQNAESGGTCYDASNADRINGNAWRTESAGQQRKAGAANGGYDVADADGSCRKRTIANDNEARRSGPSDGNINVSYSNSAGWPEFSTTGKPVESGISSGIYFADHVSDTDDRRGPLRRNGQLPTASEIAGWWGDNREGTPGHVSGEWWSVEPDVGRVAYGVPDRVDRLKSLGNAVVPHQAYPIFRAIAEIERQAWSA